MPLKHKLKENSHFLKSSKFDIYWATFKEFVTRMNYLMSARML